MVRFLKKHKGIMCGGAGCQLVEQAVVDAMVLMFPELQCYNIDAHYHGRGMYFSCWSWTGGRGSIGADACAGRRPPDACQSSEMFCDDAVLNCDEGKHASFLV